MERILETLLNSNTETEFLEFKEAKNQFDKNKLGRYFSALSNEANLRGRESAWLLFGVKNDKSIVGTNITNEQLNDYKYEINKNTSPKISFIEIHKIKTNKKIVLMLEIPAAPKGMPVAWKGHYYGRDGESLGALNIEKLERIRNQNKFFDWSAIIIEKATINDLSKEAINKSKEQFIEKNPHLSQEIKIWNNIQFLNKAKITIKGQITNTAILLLGKSESEHFITPATSKITWILRDRDNIEKDYVHFNCPLFLEIDKIHGKIRNLKYRYLQKGTLFPDEVDQYDPFIIREALNNCIAHQDYQLGGRINVVEREDGILTFTNLGSFIPKSLEEVIISDAPEEKYRNPFLATAMVNLNMIDTMGSGIKRMFVIQKNKYFPLPEYNFENNIVKVQFTGKVVDKAYAEKLAQMPELNLQEVMLLDKVQKKKVLTKDEIKILRKKKLVEGRKPNFHISSNIAKTTGEKEDYIKLRGFKDDHYKKMILELIEKYGQASKKEIDNLILDILPAILNKSQRENKVRNIIYSMSKRDKSIVNKGTTRYPKWELSSSKNSVK